MTLNALANGLFWCLIFWMVFVFAICSITAAASSVLERSLQATIEDVEPKMAYAKSMYNATQVRQQPDRAQLSFESKLSIYVPRSNSSCTTSSTQTPQRRKCPGQLCSS
jgi:ABC-type transport system involved in multi-copper enzyme maturation permease subunit